MFMFRLVPMLILFLLLSGQVPILSGQAYAAGCCPCGMCRPGCTCGCQCLIQGCLQDLIGGEEFTLKTAQYGPVKIVADPEVLAKLKQLKRGDCGNFSLKLFGDAEKGLQFRCTGFDPLKKGAQGAHMTVEFDKVMSMPGHEPKE